MPCLLSPLVLPLLRCVVAVAILVLSCLLAGVLVLLLRSPGPWLWFVASACPACGPAPAPWFLACPVRVSLGAWFLRCPNVCPVLALGDLFPSLPPALCRGFYFCFGGVMSGFGSGVVGFSGSRSVSPSLQRQAGLVVTGLLGLSCPPVVGVGCAAGLDRVVRHMVPEDLLRVFRVEPPLSRGAFAARSSRLVAWVSAVPGSFLFVFPGCVCPSGLVPSATPGRCFSGFGSGSWATAALAAGSGVSVVVFGVSGPELPAWPGGSWSASPQFGVPAFRWFPSLVQGRLF